MGNYIVKPESLIPSGLFGFGHLINLLHSLSFPTFPQFSVK